MASSLWVFLLVCCVLTNPILSYPMDNSEMDLQKIHEEDIVEQQPSVRVRYVRSLQPGAPNYPVRSQKNGGWQLDPSLSRDPNGNTKGSINIQHSGSNHQVNAKWEKVMRGPNRAKPVWSIHGTYKW